jgi:lipoprotein-anchoring transpeptidase ErfK/SrfK
MSGSSKQKVIFAVLLSVAWVAPALNRFGTTALSAHELVAYAHEGGSSEYIQEGAEIGEAEEQREFTEAPDFGASAASVSTDYGEGTAYFEAGEDAQTEYDDLDYDESNEDLLDDPEPAGYDESGDYISRNDGWIAQDDGLVAQIDYERYEPYQDAVTATRNEVTSSENSGNRSTPPPEPTEWIAAWVDDLKQSSERWIEVNLSNQEILAWEGDTVVFSAPVSTGREGDWTPPGVYAIEAKYDKSWMQGNDYDIPNVPYVMYFFGSYAIHGAYWRDSFGTPASRGCINMSVDQAKWLYSWAAEGTPVVIER